ncbi:MAG TPA: fluoride efflux transporter CrcB [Solirubrobacteraceae bacterium]|jgi:CrcB protein|nr:fluoride efflux transporter CrcB [Solirubrobacteraceae bacterium]
MPTLSPDRSHPSRAILVGGALGTLARVGLAELWPPTPGQWPWATLGVNLVGALVLGLAVTRGPARSPRSVVGSPLWGTGFCGALTTFSAVQLELLQMLDEGRVALAALYAVCSLGAGLTLVGVGSRVARGRLRAAETVTGSEAGR